MNEPTLASRYDFGAIRDAIADGIHEADILLGNVQPSNLWLMQAAAVYGRIHGALDCADGFGRFRDTATDHLYVDGCGRASMLSSVIRAVFGLDTLAKLEGAQN